MGDRIPSPVIQAGRPLQPVLRIGPSLLPLCDGPDYDRASNERRVARVCPGHGQFDRPSISESLPVGSALARVAWSAFLSASRSILETGAFDAFSNLTSFAELNAMFSKR